MGAAPAASSAAGANKRVSTTTTARPRNEIGVTVTDIPYTYGTTGRA